MLSIEADGASTLCWAADGAEAHVNALRRRRGFLSAALFRPVTRLGERVAYVRWADREAANRAVSEGDRVHYRTALVEPYAVRTKAVHGVEGHRLALERTGATVLISAMSIDPAASDRLADLLSGATDQFLPGFKAVQGVAFHRSRDHSLIVEVLHVSSAVALGLTQLTRKLRRHRRNVEALTQRSLVGVYRLQQLFGPNHA